MDTTSKGDFFLNRFVRVVRRLLQYVRKSPLITWASGYVLGILTSIYPVPFLVILGILTLLFVIVGFVRAIKAEQLSKLSDWELTLLDPDKYAAATVRRANEDFLVVGQAIQLIPHPDLSKRAAIDELGWDPVEVQLKDLQENFDAKEILDRTGGYREFDPPNGKKFCLSGTSYVTKDSNNLVLNLRCTDYFTIMSVLPDIKKSPELRAEFGALDPAFNRVPNSLCLHYVVRFSGGDVLCMKRDPRSPYHGNLWSFSGEEQLSESDFKFQFPGQAWFRRTFCEEVLALRDEYPLEERWEVAKEIVKNMSLWSIFVEEGVFNFSLLGVYNLSVNTEEFVSFNNKLINKGMGSRDNEGKVYVATNEMLKTLLFKSQCNVRALFGEKIEVVHAEELHPTSRYRIFRLLRAVYRKPLQPEM